MNNIFYRNLGYGSWSGPFGDVWKLQTFLRDLGFANFNPTGFFGEKTVAALKSFQMSKNIIPNSGNFGPKTIPALLQAISDARRKKIYDTAIALIGTDVTPEDIVPDEYDCADTVSTILKKAGFGIGNIISTYEMYNFLRSNDSWSRVFDPLPGDIVISPTGLGNGKLSNGHVGICGKNEDGKQLIMSNNSFTGKFEQNYTLDSWKARYRDIGGFPVLFIRKL